MRRWLSPALAIALAVLGLLWLRDHDGKVVAEALAGARGDSLQIRHAELEALRRESAFKDLAYDALQADLDSAYTRAERVRVVYVERESDARLRVREAGESLDATLDSVRTVAPVLGDSAKAQVGREREGHEQEKGALRGQNAEITVQRDAALSSWEVERNRVGDLRLLVASLETTVSEERGLREFYQGWANPGLPTKLWRDAPSYLAVAGIAVLAWEMAR